MPKAATAINKMRHRLVIQTPTHAADGQGGSVTTWSTFSTVWGELLPATAYEINFAKQLQAQRTHKATIRFLNGLDTKMRILFDSRYFQLKGIRFPDERKFFMTLDLTEDNST